MTDNDEPLITKEDIERLKTRDSRWKDIDVALRVDEEIRESLTVNLFLHALTRRADEALEKLVDADPLDSRRVATYQAEIKSVRFIAETLERIRTNGLNASAALEFEGEVELNTED